mgnify:CR=1 FL=1
MQKQQIPLKNSLLLLLAAIIWGIAFVAQSVGMKYVGGFTFNAVRSLIGAVVLIPLIFILKKRNSPSDSASKASGRSDTSSNTVSNMQEKKTLIIGGIACGICLCLASNFQQFGIKYTTVGKSRLYHCLLYCDRPCHRTIPWQKMHKIYLGCRCNGSDRTLSPVHHRWIFYRKRRSARTGMRISIFTAHTGHRLLFSKSRRSKALLHSVPDMWYPFRHSRSAP